MHNLIVGIQIVIALLLCVSGTAKLFSRSATIAAFDAFGFRRFSLQLALVLPIVELSLSSMLLFGTFAEIASWVTTTLFVVFTIVVIRSYQAGDKHDCNCFGSLSRSRVGPTMIIRNCVLSIASFAVSITGGQNMAIERIVAALPLVGPGRLSVVVFELFLQSEQTLCFILIVSLFVASIIRAPSGRTQTRTPRLKEVYIPNFLLSGRNGDARSWQSIRSTTGSTVVLFLSGHCAACRQLVERVEVAGSSLSNVVVVLQRQVDLMPLARLLERWPHVYYQESNEIAILFGLDTTPSALQVSLKNTLIGKPALSSHAILQIIEPIESTVECTPSERPVAALGIVQ